MPRESDFLTDLSDVRACSRSSGASRATRVFYWEAESRYPALAFVIGSIQQPVADAPHIDDVAVFLGQIELPPQPRRVRFQGSRST